MGGDRQNTEQRVRAQTQAYMDTMTEVRSW